MARIRMITPGFFDDPDIAELSPLARLFFIGLWTQADREGRLFEDLRRLKTRILPYDDVSITVLVRELHCLDFIRRYKDSAGNNLIWVRNFTKHQRPHLKEAQSLIAACPNGEGMCPERVSASPDKAVASTPESGVLILDSGVRNLETAPN